MPSNNKHVIVFNFIFFFYLRLFSLTYLEDLDVSYNSIASIPNEIQKLRYFGSSKYTQSYAWKGVFGNDCVGEN